MYASKRRPYNFVWFYSRLKIFQYILVQLNLNENFKLSLLRNNCLSIWCCLKNINSFSHTPIFVFSFNEIQSPNDHQRKKEVFPSFWPKTYEIAVSASITTRYSLQFLFWLNYGNILKCFSLIACKIANLFRYTVLEWISSHIVEIKSTNMLSLKYSINLNKS